MIYDSRHFQAPINVLLPSIYFNQFPKKHTLTKHLTSRFALKLRFMWKYQDSNKLIWVSCLNLLCFQHTKKHSKHSLDDDITLASIFQQPSGFRFKLIDLEKPWMCQFLFALLFFGRNIFGCFQVDLLKESEDHFLPKNTFRSSA